MLCLLGFRQAHGQVLDSARTTVRRSPRADSTAWVSLRNSRIGFNSFVFANAAASRYAQGRWLLRADAGHAILYNLSLGGGQGRFVQEDYYLRAEQYYYLRPTLTLGQRLAGYRFKAIGNAFGRYEALIGWAPKGRRVQLFNEATAGVALDERGTVTNTGPTYGIRIQGAAQSKDSSTRYTWQAQAGQAFITPRHMALWAARGALVQALGGFAETRLSAGFLRRRVEDYLLGQIQQIVSDSVEGGLFLGSQLGRRAYLQSDNRILLPNRQFNYRTLDTGTGNLQNSRFRQVEYYSRQTLGLQGSMVQQSFYIELSGRNRSYDLRNNLRLVPRAYERALVSERIKDISEETVSYGYTGGWQINNRSSLRGTWTGTRLRVNTPSEQNDQDRDEIFYTGELAWSHRWLRTLRSGLRLSGSYREVVFIKATQSAQNYMEQVLRLEPSLSYGLGPVRLTSTFGVWATYNVRQFAQEQAKNRSNRIWIQTYQARYQAPRQFYWLTDYIRRENRIAQLNWERFTESPIDTVVINDLHTRVGKTLRWAGSAATVSLEAGYKLFKQDRHFIGGVSTAGLPTRQAALHNITLQHGPTTAVVWELPGRGRIVADGWVQWARTRNRFKITEEPFVGQTYRAEDLQAVERRLYFFFNVQGQVLFGRRS